MNGTAPEMNGTTHALTSRTSWSIAGTGVDGERVLPAVLVAIACAVLFGQPMRMLVSDWLTLPEAGHGVLLAPAAAFLAWRVGRDARGAPSMWLGSAVLVFAVLLRSAAGLAAEGFSMKVSILVALVGLTIYYAGARQVRRWWLPFLLLLLAIPLPELVTQALALPLQFKASQMGAAMLELRHVPVRLSGNVIQIPGHDLFVTEACSGLRSLTALLSSALLLGGLLLRTPLARLSLLALSIPLAIVINGVRVFLTGFLVYFVSPAFGANFLHATEGWLLFLVSLGALAALSSIGVLVEHRLAAHGGHV